MDSRKKERMLTIDVYTDGSLKKIGNKTFGGWSFIVTRDNQELAVDSGGEMDTTNQRMELLAIIKALECVKDIRRSSEKVIVYSDSAYAINCYLQEWYVTWLANGWRNSSRQEVANKDLWIQIIPFFDNFWYDFRKVQGHADVYWNERCDEIAQNQARFLKEHWRG